MVERREKVKVILSMVTSVDGKSTKGNLPPSDWASREDQNYFYKLIKKHKVMVMGRRTYELVRPYLRLDQKILRIVMTKNPKKFSKEVVHGKLEFTDFSPLRLYDDLKSKGYKEVLLVTGESLNSEFLKFSLVNEIWLTLEPKIFGKGKGLVNKEIDINLKLKSISKLNKQGTILLKYQVI